MWVVFWSGHFPDFCFTFFTFENQKAFDETVTLPPADHQKLFSFPRYSHPYFFVTSSSRRRKFEILIVEWTFAYMIREGVKKKTRKKRSGWLLGLTPKKNYRQVVILGVVLPFYKGQNGSKSSQNRSGQAGGGWPPLPPPSGQPDRFFTFLFTTSHS